MARKIGGWRWKSADICEKEHARRAVSKWKAVRAAARCQKSVRKTQIGRARRHYPHGGEVTRQKLCAGKMRGGNSASGQAGNHIIGIPAASSATYGRRQCGDGCSSPFFHYYNIIVTFFDLLGFFRSRPESPVIRAFRIVKSACFILLRRDLTNISRGGIISAQKRTNVRFDTRGVPEPSSGITGRLF